MLGSCQEDPLQQAFPGCLLLPCTYSAEIHIWGRKPLYGVSLCSVQELHFDLSASLAFSSVHSNSVPSNWGLHRVGAIARTMQVPIAPSVSPWLPSATRHPKRSAQIPRELLPSSMASAGL